MTEKLGELGATDRVIPKSDPDRTDGPKPGGSEDPYKLPKIHLPKFKGGLEQWQTYWGRFQQAVHDNPKLGVEAKMAQLLETIEDPTLSEYLNACNDGTGRYPEVIAYLKERFDQPKELHGIYCQTLANLQPIKGTQAEIQKLADTLFAATSGLTRLGQDTIESIATSLALPTIPRHLRTEWENKTETEKQVPSIFEFIKFLRRKATTAKREQKIPAVTTPQDSKRGSRQQAHRPKGSVHVAVNHSARRETSPQPSQPTNSPTTFGRQKGNYQKNSKGAQYPQCKYECKLCHNNHYAFSCSVFEQMSVAQRMEHVRTNNLCQNCLKPGHAPSDCRSEYKCRVCRGQHNTMVHPDGSVSNPHQVAGNTNHVNSSTDVLHKGKFLPTSQVVITGPTGKSLLVRALLDSGSTVSLITKKAAKHIALKNLGTTMTVSSLGDVITEPSNPTVSVSIFSLYRKDWSAKVIAGVTQTITGYIPHSPSSSVRDQSNVRDLELADPNFDVPGKIDLLLGEDILPEIQMLNGPKDGARVMETVFGWVVRGLYTPGETKDTVKAVVHLAIKAPEEEKDSVQDTTDALVRFWESEEPSKPTTSYSSEETRVLDHYNSTHMYVSPIGKYMVTLPKKESASTLGESRSRALRRFYSNERSLLNKGTWKQFQDVVQEYLDLGHARLVTAEELKTPQAESYYLPMHGVHKQSSSTTKLRVVFDGSAKTTTKVSLNDILSVGPTIHPTLDKILLKFRTYQVAVTGDISKMYREVLLSPPDQQLHRFLWRSQTDQPISDYCMERVTFGVASSPFLAIKTLQQAALDFGNAHPICKLACSKFILRR